MFCILLSQMSLLTIYKYSLLFKNAFIANLRHQQLKNVLIFSRNIRYFCPISEMFEVSRKVAVRANTKFHGNLSSGRHTDMRTGGQTGGSDEANSRFSRLGEGV